MLDVFLVKLWPFSSFFTFKIQHLVQKLTFSPILFMFSNSRVVGWSVRRWLWWSLSTVRRVEMKRFVSGCKIWWRMHESTGGQRNWGFQEVILLFLNVRETREKMNWKWFLTSSICPFVTSYLGFWQNLLPSCEESAKGGQKFWWDIIKIFDEFTWDSVPPARYSHRTSARAVQLKFSTPAEFSAILRYQIWFWCINHLVWLDIG